MHQKRRSYLNFDICGKSKISCLTVFPKVWRTGSLQVTRQEHQGTQWNHCIWLIKFFIWMPTVWGSKSHSLDPLYGVLAAFGTGNLSAGSSRPHLFSHWSYLQSYYWDLSSQGIDCKWKQDWTPNFCLRLDGFMKTIQLLLFTPKLFEPTSKDKQDDYDPLL